MLEAPTDVEREILGAFPYQPNEAILHTDVRVLPCADYPTLPAAMRARLGITAGSHIHFELRGKELVIKPELPISAYYGILKPYNLDPADLEIPKEKDRDFL